MTNWLSKASGGSAVMFQSNKDLSFGGNEAGVVGLAAASFSTGSIEFLPVSNQTKPYYTIGSSVDDGSLYLSANSVIYAGALATIQSRILTDYEKTGPAELIVKGTNQSTGLVKITSGRLTISGASAVQNSNISNNSQLLVDKATAWTYNYILDGTGTLNKSGAGRLVLARNNLMTGRVTITGEDVGGVLSGGIDIGAGSVEGALPADIEVGGELRFNRSDSFTYDKVLSGSSSGKVIKLGAGKLTLLGDNTFAGLTTVSMGQLEIGNGAATGLGFNATLAGPIALGGAATELILNLAGTRSIPGIISGDGGVTKRGAGTVSLAANSSYGGDTIIEAGVIELGSGSGLGSALGKTVVNNGASLHFKNSFETAENITIIGSGLAAAGALRNGTGLVKLTGTVTLSDNSTLSSSGGILNIENVTGLNRNLTLLSTATAATAALAPLQLTKSISLGTGKLEKTGEGSATLSGVANFTGGLYVLNGTLFAQSLTALGQGTDVEVGAVNAANQPKLAIETSTSFGGAVRLHEGEIAGPGTLTAGTYDLRKGIVSASLLGSAGLAKTSAGEVVLSGTNGYQGLTSVDGGILAIMNAQALGDLSAGTIVGAGGSLVLRKPTGAYGLTINEEITIAGAGNRGALRSASGANMLSGNLMLGGDATIYVDSGSKSSLRLSAVGDGSPFVLTVDTQYGASVYLTGGYALGGGKLVKQGSGTLEISSAGTIDGLAQVDGVGVEILGGRVVARHAQALGAGIVKVGNPSSAGTLQLAVPTDLPGVLRLDNGTVSGFELVARSYDLRSGTVSASLGTPSGADPIALAKTSAGTVLLTGNNTYAGITRITGGVLQVGSNGLGSAADSQSDYTVVAGLGALELMMGTAITDERIIISGDGQAGFGALRTKGDGRTVSIAGPVVIDDPISGSVQYGRINNRDRGDVLRIGGLQGANKDAYFGQWNAILESDGRFHVDGAVALGTGRLVVEGQEQSDSSGYRDVSSLRLSGAGAFSGGTTIGSGVVIAAHENAMGSGDITVGSATRRGVFRTAAPLVGLGNVILVNGALEGETFRGPGNSRFKYDITSPLVELQNGRVSVGLAGAGSVSKTTNSTVSLYLANSYAGTTDISGGILEIRNALSLGTSASGTAVHAGATLKIARRGTVVLGESLVLAGDGVNNSGALFSVGGNNQWIGDLSLDDDARINASSSFMIGGASSSLIGNNHNLKFGGSGAITLQKALQLGSGSLIKDGSGSLTLAAPAATASADLIRGRLSLTGFSLNSPTLFVRPGSTLSGYGQVAGDVTVVSGANSVIEPGTIAASPTSQMLSLATNNLTFSDRATVKVRNLANYRVADTAAPYELDGPAPLVVNGNLSFLDPLAKSKRVKISVLGGDPGNGKFRLFEYTGNLSGDFNAYTATPSVVMSGIKKGYRQNFGLAAEVDAQSGRKFITFSVENGRLVWRGTRTNRWDTATDNWSLSQNIQLSSRVNVIQDDATVFDDRADGNTMIRVVPGVSGIKPVVSMLFENTDHRDAVSPGKEYTFYRDFSQPDDNGQAVDLLQTDMVTIGKVAPPAGKQWGVVNIKTALKIRPETGLDADEEPNNGLHLIGGTLRAGHDQALGGARVDLIGGRLTTFESDDRSISGQHQVSLLTDEVIFGEAGHDGTLIFNGTFDFSDVAPRLFTVAASA